MKLTLSLPGWMDPGTTNPSKIFNPAYDPTTRKGFDAGSTTLGDVINKFGEVALYVGGFMMFFWAVWGVFDYLRAEGNKEALAKARKKIQWAIAGFIILLMAFFVSDFVQNALLKNPSIWQRGTQSVQNLTKP